MRLSRHRRQALLFLAVILAPAAALIALTGRVLGQERELAASRASEQHRILLNQTRRELSARLDAIRLEEVNRLIRIGPERALRERNPAGSFAAQVTGDQVDLPWRRPGFLESTAFLKSKGEGETLEFRKGDYKGAAAVYRSTADSSPNSTEKADARLCLARVLVKAGDRDSAARIYGALLGAPAEARDDQGVGYRLYAAERLLSSGDEETAARQLIDHATGVAEWPSPAELYLVRPFSPASVEPRIEEIEQIERIAADFAHLRARIETGAAWVPAEGWLMSLMEAQPPLPPLLIAVPTARVLPPGTSLAPMAGSEPLGEPFPGVYVAGLRPPSARVNTTGIWAAGLLLLTGVGLFGGYLLVRDVHRETQMTEVRSQFVASVSHELKTPLTAIRMFAETLAMGRMRDSRTSAEYLETIVGESERLTRLVDNVLDFSKIEQGSKIYHPRPIRLEQAARSAIRTLQFPLDQQGFRLSFRADDDLPEIEADPDAIEQAILNLLSNAVKYSGDSREIEMSLTRKGDHAVLEVRDRGLGLSPEERERVFEKFYRAPSHEAHSIAGTGLGLTVVAHIAATHGGKVEVESAPGEGSTFRILLPLREAMPA